jgi:hypothetical protein
MSIETLTPSEIRDLANNRAKQMDRIFNFNPKNNTLVIDAAYPYEIDLDRVKHPMSLVRWVAHLSEKTWMDTGLINEFILRVCAIKGWDPYGL